MELSQSKKNPTNFTDSKDSENLKNTHGFLNSNSCNDSHRSSSKENHRQEAPDAQDDPALLNPLELDGIEWVEFASPKPDELEKIFFEFGFSKALKHFRKNIDYFYQNDIHFLLNREVGTFAESFWRAHGPSICSMGLRVKNAERAKKTALQRGARAFEGGDYLDEKGASVPAIYGIGDSAIYFIDNYSNSQRYETLGFRPHPQPLRTSEKGFLSIDHLTNNVPQGTMKKWSQFYKDIFGFTEVRYFDIRGAKTGLTSFALRSPCGKFCIPINEGTEQKSQINEYLREYKGAGVQHLAFLSNDLLTSLRALEGSSIQTLDIDHEYYETIFERVPNVTEDHHEIERLNVLVDGDSEGYLLQIFTKNMIGPIFIEMIQRKNHLSFGEGNFGALFRSIERDQEKRGVI